MSSNELTHHGIKGMRWGVRRYQNKDGSLTKAGRKKMAKLDKEYSKLIGQNRNTDKKSLNTKSLPIKKKKLSDMTDDEIRARINRINLERDYLDLINNQDCINKQSEGKGFIKTVRSDVIKPVAIDLGRQALKSGGVKILNNLVKNPELKLYTNNKKKS